MKHTLTALTLFAGLWPSVAGAQTTAAAPLLLGAPLSARAVALGGAWVAGRDQDVVFSNPAQLIGGRSDFALSMTRRGPDENSGSFASTYASGKMSFTLGFGAQIVNTATSQTSLAVVDGAVLYKTFRIGAAGKYVGDASAVDRHALLLDLGVARTLFGGVAGLAVQNLGPSTADQTPSARLRRQVALGWSTSKPAGPLDLALYTQVMARSGWASPAAGLEAGYSWIEGYSVAVRAGARRPDNNGEKPIALGAAFIGDRLTMEYAIRFFDNSRRAHLVTVRWR
jgi:hypothetical protein